MDSYVNIRTKLGIDDISPLILSDIDYELSRLNYQFMFDKKIELYDAMKVIIYNEFYDGKKSMNRILVVDRFISKVAETIENEKEREIFLNKSYRYLYKICKICNENILVKLVKGAICKFASRITKTKSNKIHDKKEEKSIAKPSYLYKICNLVNENLIGTMFRLLFSYRIHRFFERIKSLNFYPSWVYK